MKLTQSGIDLIKSFESCRLTAYPDPGTKAAPYTIGYGHTGSEVHLGLIWTIEQAESALLADLSKVVAHLQPLIHLDLNDNQFSACVSLAYNIGVGNFEHSTLLRMINAGGTGPASLEFPKWDKAAGKEMPGLLRRRLAEQRLFNS